MAQTLKGTQPGTYAGVLPADVYSGRVTLGIRFATGDSPDDPDDLPELRTPANASLTITPSFKGFAKLTDGSVVALAPMTYTTDDGQFDFYCIDGSSPGINPSGFNWTAQLVTEMGSTSFVFQPDKDTITVLGKSLPLQIAAGVPVIQGDTGPGISDITMDNSGNIIFTLMDSTTKNAGNLNNTTFGKLLQTQSAQGSISGAKTLPWKQSLLTLTATAATTLTIDNTVVPPDGTTFTLHVKSGLQYVSFPAPTVVYGAPTGDSAYATVMRESGVWNVLWGTSTLPPGGTDGQVLTKVAGVPAWASSAGVVEYYNAIQYWENDWNGGTQANAAWTATVYPFLVSNLIFYKFLFQINPTKYVPGTTKFHAPIDTDSSGADATKLKTTDPKFPILTTFTFGVLPSIASNVGTAYGANVYAKPAGVRLSYAATVQYNGGTPSLLPQGSTLSASLCGYQFDIVDYPADPAGKTVIAETTFVGIAPASINVPKPKNAVQIV